MGLRRRFRSKGFVLIAATVMAVVFLGILGLATDLGRMYVARNELQAFTDAAATAAARHLDGSDTSLTHARTEAQNYPNKWNFQTANVQNIQVTFAELANGPYAASPPAAGVKFVRVQGETPVTVYFLPGFSTLAPGPPVLPSPPVPAPPAMMLFTIARQHLLRATSTSGQFQITTFSEGLVPYSPDSINPADLANYGYVPGQMFTMRWPPPGQRSQPNDWCDGDQAANFISPSPASQRGFIDIGDVGGNYGGYTGGAAFIRQAIVSNIQSHPLAIGDLINPVPGNRETESDALRERYGQDADTVSQTYDQYLSKINNPAWSGVRGNGRRLMTVPINDPANDVVLGYANFFIHNDICSMGGDSLLGNGGQGNAQGQGGMNACCAEYVGPALVYGRRSGSRVGGAYQVRLFQ